MRFLAFFLAIWITCLCSSTASYGRNHHRHHPTSHTTITSVNGTPSLVANINRALHSISPYSKVGITIKSMKYGDVLYTRNDRNLFVPASTLKVFTAEAALLYLGSNFRF